MTYYTVKDICKITGKKEITIIRWIMGRNKRGIVLPAEKQMNVRSRPYLIKKTDFKNFILKLNGIK